MIAAFSLLFFSQQFGLLADLSSEKWGVRDAASQQLLKDDGSTLFILGIGINSSDLHTRRACDRILETYYYYEVPRPIYYSINRSFFPTKYPDYIRGHYKELYETLFKTELKKIDGTYTNFDYFYGDVAAEWRRHYELPTTTPADCHVAAVKYLFDEILRQCPKSELNKIIAKCSQLP